MSWCIGFLLLLDFLMWTNYHWPPCNWKKRAKDRPSTNVKPAVTSYGGLISNPEKYTWRFSIPETMEGWSTKKTTTGNIAPHKHAFENKPRALFHVQLGGLFKV